VELSEAHGCALDLDRACASTATGCRARIAADLASWCDALEQLRVTLSDVRAREVIAAHSGNDTQDCFDQVTDA